MRIHEHGSGDRVPVVLYGIPGSDPFFPLTQAEQTVAVARNGRLAVYDGARYLLPGERPKRLTGDLRQPIPDSTP